MADCLVEADSMLAKLPLGRRHNSLLELYTSSGNTSTFGVTTVPVQRAAEHELHVFISNIRKGCRFLLSSLISSF